MQGNVITHASDRRPTVLRQALLVAGALLGLLAAGIVVAQYSDLDLWLAEVYFDPDQGGFPWKQTWFARDLMHGYVKNVIVWIGFLMIGVVAFDLYFPIRRIPRVGAGPILTRCSG